MLKNKGEICQKKLIPIVFRIHRQISARFIPPSPPGVFHFPINNSSPFMVFLPLHVIQTKSVPHDVRLIWCKVSLAYIRYPGRF